MSTTTSMTMPQSLGRRRSHRGGSWSEPRPVGLPPPLTSIQALARALAASMSRSGRAQENHFLFRLLQQARDLDDFVGAPSSESMVRLFLTTTDHESGYSLLHDAVYRRDVVATLLLLRALGNNGGVTRVRPWQSLETMAVVDREGWTPRQLLAWQQRQDLLDCRRAIQQTAVVAAAKSSVEPSAGRSRSQSTATSIEDEDDLRLLSRHLNLLHSADSDEESEEPVNPVGPITMSFDITSYGCEVVTFGRAHHPALGVVTNAHSDANASTTTATSSTSQSIRPQRVATFALAERDHHGGVVAVAGATHHSLFCTASGALYACGLGKGGRLGLPSTTHDGTTFVPTRLVSLSAWHVTAVAAAENHSLCVTACGNVFAWGSNRFGQLGLDPSSPGFSAHCIPPDESSWSAAQSTKSCLNVPRRVDRLHQVTAVAAGLRHSLALTQQGHVYGWGDNSAGQLGLARRSGIHKVQRIEALWGLATKEGRVALAICAADQSSLALTAPTRTDVFRPVNEVYWWGHGCPTPTRVHFRKSTRGHVNPVAISCAQHHNVAVTSDGRVYTWGFGETLGTHKKSSNSSSSAPQLVTGLLPENGGGRVVAVSACDNHTAVVTDTGR
jgi:inhibitor of Bruton tyrosine kinase